MIFRFSAESNGAINNVIPTLTNTTTTGTDVTVTPNRRPCVTAHYDNALEIGTTIMRNHCPRVFNDLDFYRSLRDRDGCVCVDIASIVVRHNDFVHGFQVTYRSTFRDGTVRTDVGSENYFSTGFYSYHSGHFKDSTITLANNEYIRGLRINQGEILDGVTFVTNLREVHFGGRGGSHHANTMILEPSMQIVVLAGTVYNVVQRIGFYAISRKWDIVGHYIMLRWLMNQKQEQGKCRAIHTPRNNNANDIGTNILFQLPADELFQNVLKFLMLP